MIVAWTVSTLAAAFAFLAMDAAWLTMAADRLYRPKLGGILLERFAPAPAAAFYLIYLGGIMLLAVAPAVAAERWAGAVWRGALLGFVAYATYDLTNQATLRGWSMAVTLADLCWGTFVTAVASGVGFGVARWMLARI
jgi:uncharacterized membrane protein